ncbi:hypothetical protein VTK56DRAFT_6508 [Thermocarpiscus australiensis]
MPRLYCVVRSTQYTATAAHDWAIACTTRRCGLTMKPIGMLHAHISGALRGFYYLPRLRFSTITDTHRQLMTSLLHPNTFTVTTADQHLGRISGLSSVFIMRQSRLPSRESLLFPR